ncbi:hypothetical protein ACFX2C_025774 [Malus domestica]
MCLHVLIHKLQLPVAIFPAHMPSMQLTLLFPAPLQGNRIALFLFLATTIAFKRIIRKRSKDQFSGIPYNIQQIYIQHSVALAKSYRLRFDRHVQGEIMNHRSLDHPNIIRSKEMDEHVQREIMNHSSLKNPNIIRFQEVSDHRLFSFCILRG